MPRSGEWQRSSLLRRPVADQPSRGFTLRLPEEKVQFAGDGILVHLVVPAGLLSRMEPIGQAPVLFGRQACNRRFDFLNPVHTGSLAGMAREVTGPCLRGRDG